MAVPAAKGKKRDLSWFRDQGVVDALQISYRLMKRVNDGLEGDLLQAAITTILINLNDLLQKLDDEGNRYVAANDLPGEGGCVDVTDLVSKVRNATCHLGSPHHFFQPDGKFTFSVTAGEGAMLEVNGKLMGVCEYPDDVAIFFGPHRVYLGRHLLAAWNGAMEHFKKTGLVVDTRDAARA